tara:strand:- start:415 stop:735 length:321 start_codon:yes stop_codon:yes gene_type:complete
MNRYIIFLIITFTLNGCYQTSSSLVGPIYTLSSTGNLSQAFFSYSFNDIVEKNTGKNSIQHATDYLKNENLNNTKNDDNEHPEIYDQKLYDLVKSNLEKTKKILSE